MIFFPITLSIIFVLSVVCYESAAGATPAPIWHR
jgi:hypothetical protein